MRKGCNRCRHINVSVHISLRQQPTSAPLWVLLFTFLFFPSLMQMKRVALARYLRLLRGERNSRHLTRHENDSGLSCFVWKGKGLTEAFFMQVQLNPADGGFVECNAVSTQKPLISLPLSLCKWNRWAQVWPTFCHCHLHFNFWDNILMGCNRRKYWRGYFEKYILIRL